MEVGTKSRHTYVSTCGCLKRPCCADSLHYKSIMLITAGPSLPCKETNRSYFLFPYASNQMYPKEKRKNPRSCCSQVIKSLNYHVHYYDFNIHHYVIKTSKRDPPEVHSKRICMVKWLQKKKKRTKYKVNNFCPRLPAWVGRYIWNIHPIAWPWSVWDMTIVRLDG